MYAIKIDGPATRFLRDTEGETMSFYTEKAAQEEIDWADHIGYDLSKDCTVVPYPVKVAA